MITLLTMLVWLAYLIGLYFVIFWILVYLEKEEKPRLREIKEWPTVTLTVPAWNEERTIEGTVKSVLEMDYPKDKLEIIIVNDGSTDRTREIVEKVIRENKDFNIKLINQPNAGKGAAAPKNTALKYATGEYFVNLDADSYVDKDTLKKILPHFYDDNVAVVLPLMKVKDPKTIIEKIQWCEYLLNFFYKKIMAKLDCVQVAPGPFSVYRKDVLEKLNGFEEDSAMTEDLEICLRLQKKHYKIIQLLDAEVYTVAPNTLKGVYKQRNRWYKGIIYNAFRYRDMVLNRKYGDFGIIQMPRILFSGAMAVGFFSITVYKFLIRPIWRKLYELFHINFNVGPAMKVYLNNFNIVDINYTNIFFAVVIFGLAAGILIIAYRKTREPMLKYGPITVPAYLFLYSFIASIAWAGAIFDICRRKKLKWE